MGPLETKPGHNDGVIGGLSLSSSEPRSLPTLHYYEITAAVFEWTELERAPLR